MLDEIAAIWLGITIKNDNIAKAEKVKETDKPRPPGS